MQKVRIRKQVNISDMLFPTPQITLDLLQRVSELYYQYQSINVTYTVTWQGETNLLNTYSQTVEENTP